MKKTIFMFSLVLMFVFASACTPEALQEISPVACCDNSGDIPPPPPPPPPPPGIGDGDD